MAIDTLINQTQGEDIIDKLGAIATNLQNTTTVTPAKFGMGYAVCDTAGATAAKTASLPNYVITEGALVTVKFTYKNTASNATLNLNSTGAKPILYKGTALTTDVISAGDICTFIYSTNAYNIINLDALSGAGAGTVKSVGAELGIITDQTSGAAITTEGSVKLNLKSTTALSGAVLAPDTTTAQIYPVTIDKDGYVSVPVPWTDTHVSVDSALSDSSENPVQNKVINTALAGKLGATANAASAAKLNNGSADIGVGSATKGVYFNNGVPTAMTYEVKSEVPADAVFTDTKCTFAYSGTKLTITQS